MSPAKYLPLPARGFGWSGHARLWQGPDHLLLTQANGFTENYKRFFFADIQALTVRRTAAGRIWNGIWAWLFLMFVLIALQFSDETALIPWGIAALFVTALVINFALGPTCACHVRTAVQTEKLTALNRLRSAEKCLHKIRPFLAAAQGVLSPDEAASRLFALLGPSAYPPLVDAPHAPPVIS
ncbi:MAG: hypothetical protein EXS33_07905 [Pedosphaera sp.]|nr:hypothetical protein [Pedosphaera sp.]